MGLWCSDRCQLKSCPFVRFFSAANRRLPPPRGLVVRFFCRPASQLTGFFTATFLQWDIFPREVGCPLFLRAMGRHGPFGGFFLGQWTCAARLETFFDAGWHPPSFVRFFQPRNCKKRGQTPPKIRTAPILQKRLNPRARPPR